MVIIQKLLKHQVNALYFLGGLVFGFALTYFMISYSVSLRTQEAYGVGLNEGYNKGYNVAYKLGHYEGYKKGYSVLYDQMVTKVPQDSVPLQLVTIRTILED